MTIKHGAMKILASILLVPLLLFTPIADIQVEASSSSLINTAKKYIGVPYKWGGTTTSGFDCSGFIRHVYNEMGHSLPRTTGEMYKLGSSVGKSNLKAGDLIFFAGPSGKGSISHAGIFIGGGQFIHASTSQGVMISSVNDPHYWGTRYVGAKRVTSATNGWTQSGNEWNFYQDGTLKTGWLQTGGKWYYMNGSGVMQTGWNLINNKWYHLNTSGAMSTGWNKVNSTWYYHDASGAMETGWNRVGGEWYFHEGSGAMQTDWNQVQNKWYHHEGSGIMETGWITKGNDEYFLYPNGEMATNTIIDGKHLAANGAAFEVIVEEPEIEEILPKEIEEEVEQESNND